MSKELQALEEIKNYVINGHSLALETEEKGFPLIENALKDYEHSQKQRELYFKQAKELKELYKEELKNTAYYNNLALKYKKALEMIKEHRLDIDLFLQFVTQNISYQHYVYCVEQSNNAFAKRFLLNKEEYELLKEILL